MSVTGPFLGTRTTESWAADERPKSWRESILYLYPNGSAPLTAITNMLESRKVDDPEFFWWTKKLISQGGLITDIYTDQGLTLTYTGSPLITAGSYLYIKMVETPAEGYADIGQFKNNHVVVLRGSDEQAIDKVGVITGDPIRNGVSSCIKLKMLEDDSNSTVDGYNLSNAVYAYVAGTAYGQGGMPPQAVNYIPTKFYNYTQISKTVIDLTRTMLETKLRTGDPVKRERREKLEEHAIEIEKALIWGVRYSDTDPTSSKPRTFTMGVKQFILNASVSNIFDYKRSSNFSQASWIESGEDWLDECLEVIFRHGSRERLALGGSLSLLAIQKLAKINGSHIKLDGQTLNYGIKVKTWVTSFGDAHLLVHPIFNDMVSMRRTLLLLEPDNLVWAYITDTKKKDVTPSGYDGKMEELLTEAGLELHHPETFGWLSNLGVDNTV